MSRKVLSIALNVVAVGLMFVPGLGTIAAFGLRIGVGALLSLGLGIASSVLLKPRAPRVSNAAQQRLHATLVPDTPRVLPVGLTACGTDVRYETYTGSQQEYYHQILCAGSSKLKSIDELWFDSEKAWSATGGYTSAYAGYLDVDIRNPGSAANTIAIDANWGSGQRLTGCAYLHLRFKLTGNSKKAESPFASSIPTRVTVRGRGALLPDIREVGCAIDNQATWDWFSDDSGRNPALQLLGFYVGWRINGKVAVGCGLPSARLDLDSFITAANMCDEPVTLAVGGTEPRYRSDGIISEGDDREVVIGGLCAAMNAIIRDDGGRISVHVLHNDLATPACDLSEADVLGDEHWLQTPSADAFFNKVRGRYVDGSDAGLYQLVDYPPVTLDSIDDIDRIDTFDLPFVQSASQAQRLAKQRLERNQYQGTYSAKFNHRAWRCNLGTVVRFSHVSLGWTNKLFRVSSQTIGLTGVVSLSLQEESAAIYLWDADERPAVAAAVPTAYDWRKLPLIVALGEPTDFYDSFNYLDVSAMEANWIIYNPANVSIVASGDTNGRAAQIGDNSGVDYTQLFYGDWLAYSPEDLYQVAFDLDTQAAAAGAYLYLGVQAGDRAGNNLGGTFNYVAASAVAESATLGRVTWEGFMRGTAAVAASHAPAPRDAPVPLPDGSVSGFGQGGTVRIRPVALLHYPDKAGRSVLHQMHCRRVEDVTINWRGDWNAGYDYFPNDGAYYLGRSFGAKVRHTNQVPPSTATSNAYWFLVADRGEDGMPGDDGISPIMVTAQPEGLTVQLDSASAVKPGQLPMGIGNEATQAGGTVAITAVAIVSGGQVGGAFSVSGTGLTLDSISAEQGSVTYEVTASGQTVTKTVPFNTGRDGASGAVAQTMNVTTPQLSWTSYAAHGTAIAINASASGKLRLNLTGNMKAALGDYLQFDSKIRISDDGGASWSDVAGSEHTSTESQEVFEPHTQLFADVSGSGPYDVTGLTASAPYLVQIWDKKLGGSDDSATCNLTLYAEQIA